MSILSRLFRHSVGYYVTAFAVGLVVTALALLRNGFSLRISWVDSLTVAGAVLILLGLLFLVAHFGAFDMFGYSFSTLGNRRYKNLYEYSRAKQEKAENARPAINVSLAAEQMKKYDTVFFGYPVWWYELPMPLCTFLDSVDLTGKTVIPFYSHEGTSDGGTSLATLERLAKGANVVSNGALSLRGSKVKDSESDVREWARGFGYGME